VPALSCRPATGQQRGPNAVVQDSYRGLFRARSSCTRFRSSGLHGRCAFDVHQRWFVCQPAV